MSTTTEQPISKVIFHLNKSALSQTSALAALDRGCSLTKIAYVDKEDFNQSSDSYPITCALFENKRFEQALDWMKLHAVLPENKKIHLTGAGGDTYRQLIKEKLEREIAYIHEAYAQCLGLVFLVNNVSLEELCYPTPKVDFEELNSVKLPPIFEKLKGQQIKSPDSAKPWPAIYVLFGSGGGILTVDENQKANVVAPAGFGGKPFLGLSYVLLGTSNYDEIMEMAAKGDRKNVDTQVFEVLNDDENSPYGNLPADFPMFPFGKSTDHDKSIDSYTKEDLAASLLALVAGSIGSAVNMVIQQTKINRVYFGGNLFRGEQMRIEIERMKKLFSLWLKSDEAEFYYLKTGHTGAMGALSCSAGGEEEAI